MTKRSVKTPAAALARTGGAAPVVAGDGLENVAAGLGTDRDKFTQSRYGLPRVLRRDELENMYRSGLAKRIINTIADDMTRAWRDISFDQAKPEDLKRVRDAEKRIGLQAKVNEAIRWARLYGGACIVIGTKEKNLAKPLVVESVKQGDLKNLHVVDRWRISGTGQLTMDMASPNFGLPEFYTLAESSVLVHWTRVVRFEGERLPYFPWAANGRWHDSVLQHVLDALMNADTTTRGIATMMFEANVDVITTDLAAVLAQKGGTEKLIKRFQTAAMMKSFNRALLLDKDDGYEKKSNSFANLDKITHTFFQYVCGVADIPMTRLFGISAGGLNANGDNEVRNYYDMVQSKQESDLRPPLEYLDQVFVRSELGEIPKDWHFTFNTLWQASDLEQSEIDLNNSQRDQAYLANGVMDAGMVATELKARGTYASLTDEDVAKVVAGKVKPVTPAKEPAEPSVRRPSAKK